MRIIGQLIDFFLLVCILLLLARFVLDWVQLLARQWRPKGFVAVLAEAVFSVTDPPLRLVRGVVPPIRMGMASIDLSPIILLIALYLLRLINSAVFL